MVFNNTQYDPTSEFYDEGGAYLLNYSFSIVAPLSSGNFSLWFNVTRSRGGVFQENLSLNGSDLNVISLVSSDCGSSTDYALNLSFFTEEWPFYPVNVTYEYDFNLENAGFSQRLYGNATGRNSLVFCLTPNNVSSFVDLYVKYNNGLSERFFDFNDELKGGSVKNISAYALANSTDYCVLSVSVSV